MNQHITVNGRPWCQCSDRKLFNLPEDAGAGTMGEKLLELLDASRAALGFPVVCMNNPGGNEEAVKFLNEYGIPATLTEGACPTTTGEDIE